MLWEDAKKTGVVVSSVTVAYYFMEHSGSTLIALLSKLLMFATIASYIFTHATKLLKWCVLRALATLPLPGSLGTPSKALVSCLARRLRYDSRL